MTGRRGPPSEPTELKLIKGNPGGKALNTDEPKPERVVGPEPLEWLSEGAKAEWRKTCPKLERLGLMTEIDLEAFARYCDMLHRFHEVVAKLNSRDSYYYPIFAKQTAAEIAANAQRRVQYLCPFPEYTFYHQLAAAIRGMEREFGLTPSARSGLAVKPLKDEIDEAEDFLFHRRG